MRFLDVQGEDVQHLSIITDTDFASSTGRRSPNNYAAGHLRQSRTGKPRQRSPASRSCRIAIARAGITSPWTRAATATKHAWHPTVSFVYLLRHSATALTDTAYSDSKCSISSGENCPRHGKRLGCDPDESGPLLGRRLTVKTKRKSL